MFLQTYLHASTCGGRNQFQTKNPHKKNISSIVSMDRTIFFKKVFSTKVTVSRGVYLIALVHVSRHILLQVNFQHKEGRLAQTYHFLLDLRACTCDIFKKSLWNLLYIVNLTNLLQMRTRKNTFEKFMIFRAKGSQLCDRPARKCVSDTCQHHKQKSPISTLIGPRQNM